MTDIVDRLRGIGVGGAVAWVTKTPELCFEASDEIERLRAEVAALKKDADRYRWLRSSFRVARWDVKYWTGEFWDVMYGDAMDKQIDAALKEANGHLHQQTNKLGEEILKLRAEVAALKEEHHFQACLTRDLLPYQERAVKAEAEIDRLRAEVAVCRKDAKRLDWLQRHFFERKWDGTIGRKCDWYLVGNYRHVAQRMRGDTFREAIDAALGGEGINERR